MSTEKKPILHDTIRIFKVVQVRSEGWMTSDISGESDTCLDIIFFEKVDEFETVGALERDGEPIGNHRVVGEGIIRGVPHIFEVPRDILASLPEKALQLVELDETEGGVHLTRLEVVSSYTIQELPIVRNTIHRVIETFAGFFDVVTDTSPIPVHESLLEMCGIVEHHHTADTTRCDDMARVETRGTDVCATRASDSIRRIFKESDTWECITDRGPIGYVPYEIGKKEALGFRCDNLLELLDGWNVRIETNITEDWFETKLYERCYSRGESTRGCDHLRSFR
jgi:hypothetical protein